MRVWMIAVVAVVIGTSVGVCSAWFRFRDINESFVPYSRTKAGETPEVATTAGAGPIAVVEGGAKFDFGELPHDQTREKSFVIRNAGDSPLEVKWERASCGMCIQNGRDFQPTTVPPGGSCEVFVTYATKKPALKFSESAFLTTNDARNSSVRLDIVGIVTKAVRMLPESLALNSLSSSESTRVSVKLFGYQSDKLEWVDFTCKQQETADKFAVTSRPLDAAAVAAEERAKAGVELSIEIRSGLPLGPFSQTLVLNTKAEASQTLELKIEGTVVGDLTLVGRNVDSSKSSFNFGVVEAAKGRTAELFILAKGPHRDQLQIKVGTIDPAEYLAVEVGEPTSFGDGKTVRYPVKIAVPPGKSPVMRLGTAQGPAGRIVLHTSHPVSKELPIEVRFVVE